MCDPTGLGSGHPAQFLDDPFQLQTKVGPALDPGLPPATDRPTPLLGHRTQTPQSLDCRLETGSSAGVAIQIDSNNGGPGRQSLDGRRQGAQRRFVGGDLTCQGLQGDAPGFHLGLVRFEGEAGQMETQLADPGFQAVIPLGCPRLTSQRSQLPLDLANEVLKPEHVLVGSLEPSLSLLLATAVLEDPGCLFDHRSMIFGRGTEHLVYLALSDDHVLMAAHARVTEQFLHVEKPAVHAVDLVVGRAVPVQTPGERHLVEIQWEPPLGVVDDQGGLRPAQCGSGGSAGEDDVLHLSRAQRLCGLGPHHPGKGVDQVGLAGPVGADDHGHAGSEFEPGTVGERLETDELQ